MMSVHKYINPVLIVICLAYYTPVYSNDKDNFQLNSPELNKGVFLIASNTLNDPNFSQSVILITEYNSQGTAGIILNHPSDIPVFPYLRDFAEFLSTNDFFNFGGPVAENYISMIAQSDIENSENFEEHLFENIFIVNSPEILNELYSTENRHFRVKLYLGYAGWAPGQLESELLRGDWYIWYPDSEVIFRDQPDQIWNELILRVTSKLANFDFQGVP